MNDNVLLALSYKTERAASRRLMASGLSEHEALHQTLTISAGRQGLDALLTQRAALQQHAQVRADARAAAQALRRSAPASTATPWRAWFDGSAHPNPGRCGIGALLHGPDGQRIEVAQAAGYGNSSEAEYRALITLLQAAVAHGANGLTVYGDSRVVIDDVALPPHLAAPSLLPLHAAARALLAQLDDVRLRWIPRHKNVDADALSQRGSAMHLESPDGN
ncbi:ribonuclease HI family protein [Massilia sp. S19_KUP03_FR1]|uniref:ribonuclease HI family protein n=1 Tax=Massilia sp. S19_KUP03_FR1 TaxID=3025503 RepID=UPI002FCDBF63